MLNRMIKRVTTFILFMMIGSFVSAGGVSSEAIKKETANYLLDIKFPQGFQSEEVNITIKDFITETQTGFMKELSEDANTPADAPGKTSLNINYSIPFESKDVQSIQFNVSIFHRGAAHPSNTIRVLNFIKGKPVQLGDLFVPGSDYLSVIAKYSSKAITAKDISDENWIKDGTKPTLENYSTWCFSKKGISIIFNTYQVAAYVYGEQRVEIPLSLISSNIKPEVSKVVWSD